MQNSVIQQIEKIRKRQGYSKKEFAKSIEMSEKNYGDITLGKIIDYKISLIFKSAKILDVPITAFFKEERLQKNINNENNNENKYLKKEIELLEKTIKDKEEIIELMKQNRK